MANTTYNSYSSGRGDRKLQISEFRGVDQSRGWFSNDYATSPDAINFIARNGVLRTHGGVMEYAVLPVVEGEYLLASKPRLFQAFFRDSSGNETSKLIASFNRTLYVYDAGTSSWTSIGSVGADDCDMVCYRHEETDWAIFTDGAGNCYYWDGSSASITGLLPTQGSETIKFQQIALLYERIFGAVLKEAPDRIYYSESFDPTDWEFNYDSPDDGGGLIDVATFDGSRIRAILPAFGDMLIFKDKSIHKINGTYPGEWLLSQIYGNGGTLAPRSIVNAGTSLYFLTSDGLCKYDGSSVYTLKSTGDRKLQDIWDSMNDSAVQNACAAFYNNVIYLAVSLDSSESRNTHVIEYDVLEQTYSVVELAGIDGFLVLREGQDETLLAIAWNKVYRYDAGATFDGEEIDAAWTSPEISTGTLSSKKQTGYVYMEVDASSLTVGVAPQLKFSIISNGRTREKTLTLKTGLNTIRKRIKNRGRSFKFKIENVNGNPLTVRRGIEILIEEDFD